MISKYTNKCSDCGMMIREGVDEIIKNKDTNKWVHKVHPVPLPVSSFDASQAQQYSPTYLGGLAASIDSAPMIADTTIQVDDKPFTPSVYQQDLFDFGLNNTGNAVVNAVAGSGKTTSIVQLLKRLPPNMRVIFLAFSREIVKTLRVRLPQNVKVATTHSYGLEVIRSVLGNVEISDHDNDKLGNIMNDIWPIGRGVDTNTRILNRRKRRVARDMVSLGKSIMVNFDSQDDLMDMVERFSMEIDPMDINSIFGNLPGIVRKSREISDLIDFDDMIDFPVMHQSFVNLKETYDLILIDEDQDLNALQIAFIMKIAGQNGRVIAVGDRNQSLFGFRGADIYAVPRLIDMLGATELPLSVCYRCAKEIVNLAQTLVPEIEAAPGAVDGQVREIPDHQLFGEMQPGDMVICRTNGPLVAPAFEMIRRGMKAVIKGQDIGRQLVNFVEKFEAPDLMTLDAMMTEYEWKEVNRLMDASKELAAETLQDKCNTIRSVASECQNLAQLVYRLRQLFDDNLSGVGFSSIHRSKGLEATRVFILRPELLPHPKAKADWELVQEANTKYVGITRAKLELVFVRTEQNV